MRLSTISPMFVEFIPRELDEGVLYISERFKTASHKCACGCGEKVVTPLSPAEWKLRLDGDLVSLYPSIGNWNFPCRSHYWIQRNKISWAEQFTDSEIAHVQRKDLADKKRHIQKINQQKEAKTRQCNALENKSPALQEADWLTRLVKWIKSFF